VGTDSASPIRLALLPSPLLGPAVWAPVASELTGRGRDVLLPAAYGEVRGPADVVDHLLGAIPEDAPVVLVPHSNAGLFAGAIASARDVRGIVFADARPPSIGPIAETPLRDHLATLVDEDGLLPVWTRWWPDRDLAGLCPDPVTQTRVEAEQVRLPLAYFDARVPVPTGWEHVPAAYLAFGDTYASERAEAGARGWPVTTLPGRHLHMLVDPAAVTDVLLVLLGRLGLNSV
jgi:hypothetical protein